jgi:hypothetical protein
VVGALGLDSDRFNTVGTFQSGRRNDRMDIIWWLYITGITLPTIIIIGQL